jgi:RNA polymerase sigma-70 factor (ECF subfamily)
VLRLDRGAVAPGASKEVRGASAVAKLGFSFSGLGWVPQPALVNGAAGVVVTRDGRPFSVVGFTVRQGRIVAIDILADPARLRRLDLAVRSD